MKYLICLILLYGCLSEDNSKFQKKSIDTLPNSKDIKTSQVQQIDNLTNRFPEPPDSIFSVSNGQIHLFLREYAGKDFSNPSIGNAIKIKIDTLENADTFTGCIVTSVKYRNIHLEYFQPPSDNPAWLRNIKLMSPDWKTKAGISIGDQVEKINSVYPTAQLAKDGRSIENNGYYIYTDAGDSKEIRFTVKKGKVTAIELSYILN